MFSSLNPGDPIPSNRSLRQEFSASQTTIDRALRTLRNEGLVGRQKGARCLVIREVMENISLRVKLIRPDWPSSHYDSIFQSIASFGHQRRWLFDHFYYRTMAGLDLEHAMGDCQAGVFLATTEVIPDHLVKAFAKPHAPLVMVQDHRAELQANSVCVDDRQMATTALTHLMEQGHRRILLIVPTAKTGTMRDCIEGWRQCLSDAGEQHIQTLLLDCDTPAGVDSRKHTYEVFKAFLQSDHPPFSAIYSATTPVMSAVLRATHELNINIPGQLSLLTADESGEDAAYQIPPVTSMMYDCNGRGLAVVRLIEQQLMQPSTNTREVWIQGYIEQRQSVRPFNGKLLGKS